MNTTLLSLLTRGLQMSSDELAGIVPLVSVFSALFSHVLTLMHDVEFFDDQPTSRSTHPSSVFTVWWCDERIWPSDTHCYHIATAIRSFLPDRVKPSFVIVDIRALWCSGLSVRVPRCQKLQMTD